MSWLRPSLMLPNIFAITPSLLRDLGIKALLLDVDNTLAIYHTDVPVDGVDEWIGTMKDAGVGLYILSNAKPKRLTRFANRVKLDYFYMSLKPLPFKTLRAVKKLGLKKGEVALVGDQIFTDILGGNVAGLYTIWLDIIEPEDGKSFRIKRKIERKLRDRWE